jgi:hypothetical protein
MLQKYFVLARGRAAKPTERGMTFILKGFQILFLAPGLP